MSTRIVKPLNRFSYLFPFCVQSLISYLLIERLPLQPLTLSLPLFLVSPLSTKFHNSLLRREIKLVTGNTFSCSSLSLPVHQALTPKPKTMDPELHTAVKGDVKHLIYLNETRNHDIFLGREHTMNHTIFQDAASTEDSIKRLPVCIVQKPICETTMFGNVSKLVVDAHITPSDGVDDLSCPPPLRVLNSLLLRFLSNGCKRVCIVQKPICETTNISKLVVDAYITPSDGVDDLSRPPPLRVMNSLLLRFLSSGFKRRSKAIFIGSSAQDIDVRCIVKVKPIQLCSESDAVLLLQKHPELARSQDSLDKKTILHHATQQNNVGIIKAILNTDASVSALQDLDGQNPLHIAAELGHLEIAQILIDAFNKYFKRQVEGYKEAATPGSTSSPLTTFIQEEHVSAAARFLSFQPPWRQPNRSGKTPLHLAFLHGHKKLAAHILSTDLAFLSYLADSEQGSPISFVMEQEGFKDVAEHILTPDVRGSLMNVYLETFLQFIRENPENATIKLIKQHPKLVQFKDVSGRAILQYALDENDVYTMRVILKVQPSAVDIQDNEQEHLLIKACRKGNLSAICAIYDICPQACARSEEQTTALHNVRLQTREDYRALLAIPVIARLKNKKDALGSTPLMKAIQDNNFHLVETLLEMEGVDVMNLTSKDGKTAAALLKEKSKESTEWENLYKEATQATSYVPLGTDLKDMRTTLSVVAALLATITFAAAFTVPGGFDQNNGNVILGRKAAFIIFILSDTYAMCCSMIVLYALIWSTVQEPEKALVLIDYSVILLHHSLYGTLGAFMTGIYTMLSPKSIWVAIIILVMCSTIAISAYMIIRFKLLDKFIGTGTIKCKVPDREAELSEILLS